MIASCIAQAVMTGQTELSLNKVQLAQWHVQGCRVSNGSPYSTWGPYAMQHLGRIRQETERELQDIPVEEWPVGLYSDWNGRSGPTAHFPHLECTQTGPDTWRVPLMAEDPGHALNAWSFDLCVSPAEMEALKPLSQRLAQHCLLTSYCKTRAQYDEWQLAWDMSRLELALHGGFTVAQLQASFAIARAKVTASPLPRVPCTLAMVNTTLHA